MGLRARARARDARPLPRDEVGRDVHGLAADEPVPAVDATRYRWAVLAAGTFAQATYSAIWFGVAVMAPFLRDRFGLSLAETGVLITAAFAGSVVTLIPLGLLTDRIGERLVLFVGVALCGLSLLAAARAHGFWPLLACLVLAGLTGATVQSASGRAVMAWFPESQRGLALGIRQTAIPIGGFTTSVALPHIVNAGGTGWGFATLGLACLASAVVGGLVVREGPAPAPADDETPRPLRDRRIWRMSIGSAFVLAPQMCVIGFTVVFLHDHRGLSEGKAAAVLALVQALGIGARIGAGRWSDVAGSRLAPLRAIALVVTALVALTGALADAPLVLLIPVLVAGGVLSMSWNGLSFAAAAELAGHGRSGAAIGLQQTLLNATGSVYPGVFGAVVGATSWRVAFVGVALVPLVGWRVLRGLPG
ncbi:MAG TPA: MFS transporter [Gaiellaceae bacterium]